MLTSWWCITPSIEWHSRQSIRGMPLFSQYSWGSWLRGTEGKLRSLQDSPVSQIAAKSAEFSMIVLETILKVRHNIGATSVCKWHKTFSILSWQVLEIFLSRGVSRNAWTHHITEIFPWEFFSLVSSNNSVISPIASSTALALHRCKASACPEAWKTVKFDYYDIQSTVLHFINLFWFESEHKHKERSGCAYVSASTVKPRLDFIFNFGLGLGQSVLFVH